MTRTKLIGDRGAATYHVVRYRPKQIVLTRDYAAVFYHGGRDPAGVVRLFSHVLDGIALCDRVTEEREQTGQFGSRVLRSDTDYSYVAAIALDADGGWEIQDEASNYLGMLPVGKPLYHAAEWLGPGLLARLAPEFLPPGGIDDDS